MQVLHQGGFDSEELDRFCEVLRDNCLTSIQTLLLACKEWGITFDNDNNQLAEKLLTSMELNTELAHHVVTLTTTPQVQKALLRANELQIPGGEAGASYYFRHAERFADPNYKPTSEDIIRAKMRTTGILEIQFSTQSGQEITMVDVGGQRSERRKWLHCFGNVTAVIFLVAINEYDMVLEEDNKTNRMEESLKLFSKLTGSQWFDNVSFLLFLNKSDLFREKIKTRPLTDFFEDYDSFVANFNPKDVEVGDENFFLSCEYIKAQFVKAFKGNQLYPFVTCAIDKKNCERVWGAIKDSIITSSLQDVGI
eukprot:TRINITY_DN8030_c0_g1_i2.p1 TRINITY_DN8030_c0_g1~~TRINITY_DN8030_c0_g1_i2.p1  ORF type:complete len:309 (+),score=51.34 TRINITY_DN8030_c0_g1_i2:604-1530(+)